MAGSKQLRRTFRVSGALVVFALLSSLAADVTGQTVVGTGGGLYLEDGRLNAKQQISSQPEEDSSYDYRSDGFLTGSLWFLFQISPQLRAGSSLEYYGTYASLTRPNEQQRQQEDFEPDRYEFGRLLEAYGRFEFLVPASDDVDLVLGAVFGMPFLFPRGDLQEEIESLREQGGTPLGLPRIGYLIGPALSGRYQYNEHLFFRADILVKWEQIFIFWMNENVDGVPFRRRWTSGSLRYHLNLGIEVVL